MLGDYWKMRMLPLTKDKYEAWDRFCFESDDAWFWHTTKWLEYCVAYGFLSYQTKNFSYFVTDETEILAICPLLLENKGTHYEFSTSGSGGFGITPAFCNKLSEERKEKIQKVISAEVDKLAEQNKVLRSSFRMTPLSIEGNQYNWLLKYGYIDASINTQIIDLTKAIDILWSDLRKGHKYDVNRGKKYYEIIIMDDKNSDLKLFEQYRLLHHKAAGRVTRPIETFEMMFQWILSGEGMLCGVSCNGQFVGFSYINLYKGSAYYSSASDDPDYENKIPTSHVIQWEVIRWLKENGYKKYEIGTQQFGPLTHDLPNQKDMSISFFKRGFGGKTLPFFRGVKYYNANHMLKELREGVDRFINAYQINLKGAAE